jgi:hypothetical protein
MRMVKKLVLMLHRLQSLLRMQGLVGWCLKEGIRRQRLQQGVGYPVTGQAHKGRAAVALALQGLRMCKAHILLHSSRRMTGLRWGTALCSVLVYPVVKA